MDNLNIVTYPNDKLRQVSLDISDPTSPEIKDLIKKMIEIMKAQNGIGLAAPQLGINKNIITIDTEDGPLPLINPKIIKKSWLKENGEEGCLSVPGVYGLVSRHKKITVKAVSYNGKEITFIAKGLFARVLQHEIDHLNGILFIDKTNKIIKGEVAKEEKLTDDKPKGQK